MIFVPLPFVVALLLAILFAILIRRNEGSWSNRPFLALIALCALQSVFVGLRWGYDLVGVRYLLPVAATFVPPLVYASFCSLTQQDRHGRPSPLIFAAPAVVIVFLVFAAPQLIDTVLIILYLAYALALLKLARPGPDALDEARFEGAIPAHRALQVAALALCVSALFDLLVMLDFEWARGANVPAMVSNANLFGLLLLGLTAVIAGRSRPAPEARHEPAPAPALASAEDRDVLARIDSLMLTQALYRDENLNLARLARRAGIPSRQISGAINRLTGKNVSQYVNDHRIAEACRLLKDTDHAVTAVMFESGFQTKSNFNREFRRVTGLSPLGWREKTKAA
ncbi:MAG: helix-turn-helix domain-containing protein [Parvibaculaceae bacterium]